MFIWCLSVEARRKLQVGLLLQYGAPLASFPGSPHVLQMKQNLKTRAAHDDTKQILNWMLHHKVCSSKMLAKKEEEGDLSWIARHVLTHVFTDKDWERDYVLSQGLGTRHYVPWQGLGMRLCTLTYDSCVPIVRVVAPIVVAAVTGISYRRMVALGESHLVSKTNDIVQEDWSRRVCPPQ